MGKESKDLGTSGEDAACQHLKNIGYKIIERNFRSQQGEIDIIAKDGEFLVFIEVKNYSFRSYGSPLGAVRKSKKQSIIHAAQTYLYKNNIKNTNCRFDVLTIYRNHSGDAHIEYIKDAFYVN
ncbi:MAG: YraN family protein [Candidatus Margulisiibacteriota bacterium]